MFSLLITIVSIALVAALALATLYYGGTSFTVAQANAKAAQQRNQAQQLIGASELFFAQRGRFQNSLEELVSEGYLQSIPVAQVAVGNAFAEASWRMPMAQQPVFTLVTEEPETCRSLNAQSYGAPGILPTLQANVLIQCFGSNTRNLLTVVGRNSEHLDTVANDGSGGFTPGDITGQPVPPAGDPAWTVDPETPRNVRPGPDEDEGEGENPAGEGVLFLTPTALNFGPVATHTTSTRVVELSNVGDGPLVLGAVPQLSGDAAFVVAGTTCATSLPAGQSCEVSLSYAPTVVVGSTTATLTLTSGTSNSTTEVAVSASAYNPVSLTGGAVPDGYVGQPYPGFDFNTLLSVSNEPGGHDEGAVNWSTNAVLPAGMSLNAATGVLSGTPSALTAPGGSSFELQALYKNNEARRTFTITVGTLTFTASQLEVGENFSCALGSAGQVFCWGNNSNGQLGDGTTTSTSVPVQVQNLSGVSQISISPGGLFVCALASGDVWCWGQNATGQLGNGNTSQSSVPVRASAAGAGIAQVATGNNHACARNQAGGVRCWGDNTYGQLGNDSTVSSLSAVQVVGMATGVTQVEAAGFNTCAVQGGAVKCWGINSAGQVGQGSMTPSVTAPANVSGLSTGMAQVSVGQAHSCAIRSTNNTLWCWGSGGSGRLGNGSTTTQNAPVQVTANWTGTLSTVAMGYSHSCAVTSTGAWCWGTNSSGQLGINTTSASNVPVAVQGLPGVPNAFAGGNAATCAVANGTMYCWGEGGSGQLGTGSSADARLPVAVTAP